MKYAVNDRIQVTNFEQSEYNGMCGRIKIVREKAYTIILDNGEDLFAWEHEVKAEDRNIMKHAVGARVRIIKAEDDPHMIGAEGEILGVGVRKYTLALDINRAMPFYVTDEEIEAVETKKPLQSAMEQYGRILLPLMHGSMDAPKMVYYSSTTGSVYMMDKMMNTDAYFEVCIVKMLWDRELQDRNPNTVATEVFRLTQPRDMMENLALFCTFMKAHINGDQKTIDKMLWQED